MAQSPPGIPLMWSLMTDVCRAMGVRTDVPFNQLTDAEKEIVYHGPAEKKHIFIRPKKPPKPVNWTLPIIMRSTRWKTRWPRSRTKRA